MKKIIRISTAPNALNTFCKGMLSNLACEYEIVAVSSPGAELEELGQREHVRTIAIPMQRHISPWQDLVSLWRLYQLFRRERPDMVHSMTPKAGLLSMVAAKLAGVPIRLHTFTGLIWPTAHGWKRQLLLFTDRILCNAATHLNPEGRGVANDLEHAHLTHKPLTLLGNGNVRGIDFDYYQRSPEIAQKSDALRNRLGIKPTDFLFVFVGRIVKDKGIGELLTAFQQVVEKHPNTHLLLVGHEEPNLDPLSNKMREQISHTPHIHQLSHQQDTRPLYAAAQSLVFPSYREGMPNVVLEACAMSLPCIVTDVNGSREIIRHQISGYVIPPHDSQALTQSMLDMFHTNQREAMSKAALQFVQNNFSQAYVWENLKNYYKQILSELP